MFQVISLEFWHLFSRSSHAAAAVDAMTRNQAIVTASVKIHQKQTLNVLKKVM